MKRKLKGGILITIGYLLSPLSWWNDIFINIPIAYVFGILLGLISKKLFLPAMVAGYLMTNVLGFVLMHKGARYLKKKEENPKNELFKDIIISLIYTAVIIILAKTGIIKLPWEYFR